MQVSRQPKGGCTPPDRQIISGYKNSRPHLCRVQDGYFFLFILLITVANTSPKVSITMMISYELISTTPSARLGSSGSASLGCPDIYTIKFSKYNLHADHPARALDNPVSSVYFF